MRILVLGAGGTGGYCGGHDVSDACQYRIGTIMTTQDGEAIMHDMLAGLVSGVLRSQA